MNRHQVKVTSPPTSSYLRVLQYRKVISSMRPDRICRERTLEELFVECLCSVQYTPNYVFDKKGEKKIQDYIMFLIQSLFTVSVSVHRDYTYPSCFQLYNSLVKSCFQQYFIASQRCYELHLLISDGPRWE